MEKICGSIDGRGLGYGWNQQVRNWTWASQEEVANEYPSTIRFRDNQTLAKSKRAGSPYLDWTTLDTNVERKRKWVEIDLIDTDSERVKTAK